jgi:hypothetical protein
VRNKLSELNKTYNLTTNKFKVRRPPNLQEPIIIGNVNGNLTVNFNGSQRTSHRNNLYLPGGMQKFAKSMKPTKNY